MSFRDLLYSLVVIAAAGCVLSLPSDAFAQAARQPSVLPSGGGQALLTANGAGPISIDRRVGRRGAP